MRRGEAWLDVVEPVAGTADISGKRRGAQPRRGKLKPLAGAGEAGGDRKAQPLGPVIEPLRRGAEQILRIGQAARQPGEVLPVTREQPRKAAREAPRFRVQLADQIEAHRHRHFRRRGRGRGAAVAGMIDQRRIGLVSDRGDQRDHRGRGGAHNDLFVERHQVFETAAAARDDQQIGARHRSAGGEAVEAVDRRGDLRRRPLPLHRDRPEQDSAREPVGEAMQDVANDGAGRRGHDADDLRQERQFLLTLGGEQPLRGEALATFFEYPEERANAG
ncbi:MAG: hypothetical protein AUG47_00580 [Alphaproteobacteria bacterium 13_1_20CM_3_64_12]|nr:MAG: hypothetical protein AUG47_00580 [Alphaproteobacteria bacterium 13_1_20CM_3_64_12]